MSLTHSNVLDSTRIHPEYYKYANKICIDAQPDPNAAEATPEIVKFEVLRDPSCIEALNMDVCICLGCVYGDC